MAARERSVIVAGGGHNGLVAATLLARAGRHVTVLERSERTGGAAVSERPFPGVDVRLSRYAYLVSLFPRPLAAELGIDLALTPRRVSSCTPSGGRSLLLGGGDDAAELAAFTGDERAAGAYAAWERDLTRLAGHVFPTLLEPLRPEEELRARVADDRLWEQLTARPIGDALEERFADDVLRGVVATDALIGTFASLHDPGLAQNRCFLYHVIGGGTGRWDVPVGGMGAVSDALLTAAQAAGVTVRCGAAVEHVDADPRGVRVRIAGGGALEAGALVWAAAPQQLERMLGWAPSAPDGPGCQLKVNMVLRRLPRLRDRSRDPRDAFAGTLHLHESASQLEHAWREAAAGRIPHPLPCEVYCHTLTDPSILGPELRAEGAHTLTLFGLHVPAALFAADPERAREEAAAAALAALDAALDEPVAGCLLHDADGRPCLEVKTPADLERELLLPEGNIFHRPLQWPWAEQPEDVGAWGVETSLPTVVLGGAGARRGGGVSGIAGHNAARCLLSDSAGRTA